MKRYFHVCRVFAHILTYVDVDLLDFNAMLTFRLIGTSVFLRNVGLLICNSKDRHRHLCGRERTLDLLPVHSEMAGTVGEWRGRLHVLFGCDGFLRCTCLWNKIISIVVCAKLLPECDLSVMCITDSVKLDSCIGINVEQQAMF